jgi:hypothetical protein
MVVMSDWRLQLVPVGAEKPRAARRFRRQSSDRGFCAARRVEADRAGSSACSGAPDVASRLTRSDDSVPPGEPGQLSGLATGRTAEVVDKQLRGGRGMLSANFSSHVIHDIETTFQLRIWHRI